MDRSIKTGPTAPRLALAVTTAIAGLALSGCMTSAAPRADLSFGSAQTALAKGQVDKAIVHAEAAVLAEPRNPGFRALLGAAYLEAGRFDSAATSFGDALDLGDNDPRTVLSFALAKIALGEGRDAVAMLDDHAQAIDAADLGLALALAGQPERGVHVLVNAVRSSEQASPKLRQNLAYTYALAGNWRAARVMAAEDVPADQLEARMAGWAAQSAPGMFQQRIATLLDVSPRADGGQPQRLALANFPAQDVMVAEAAKQAQVDLAMASPAPAPTYAPAPAPSDAFNAAFAATEPAIQTVAAPAQAIRYVSNPVVQQLRGASAGRAPAAPRIAPTAPQRRMAATAAAAAPPAVRDVAGGAAAAAVAAMRRCGAVGAIRGAAGARPADAPRNCWTTGFET